jgi:hypothetical protein
MRTQRPVPAADPLLLAIRAHHPRLPADTPLTDLDPDTLLERFVATRGPGFRAATTYKSRLRKAIDLFQARLSGDPDWRDQRLGRGIQPIVATAPADTRVVVFPLRPDLTIAVELPHDLRVREAQLLSLWLTSMAR